MHPVTYEADYKEEHNRWTTGFRLILAIPWLIIFVIYAIASLFVTIIAWFALLITARYPSWAREFNTGFIRYYVRLGSWVGLQTDEWPPFGIGEDATYPVRINIVVPERQSRLKVLFRLFLAIPAIVVGFAMGLIQGGAAVVSWLSIVFRGYKPRAAHDAFTFAFTYATRLYAYYGVSVQYAAVGGLLVDDYPPISEEGYRRSEEKKGMPSGGAAAPPAATAETQVAPPPPPPDAPPPPPPPAQ